jgi:metallophosphoesterase superfamily enzyme
MPSAKKAPPIDGAGVHLFTVIAGHFDGAGVHLFTAIAGHQHPSIS